MDSQHHRHRHHHQREREKEEAKAEEAALNPKEGREGTQPKLIPILATSSSPCSSPSHEFSFAISLHSSSTAAAPAAPAAPSSLSRVCNKAHPSFAMDLAPADDIFFHGHLLPLHGLSRPPVLPVSPRTSNVSVETNPNPPIQVNDGDPNPSTHTDNKCNGGGSRSGTTTTTTTSDTTKERYSFKNKSSLSSLFGGIGKWRKGNEAAGDERDDEEEKNNNNNNKNNKKKKKRFDVSRLLRKYASVVEPFLSFMGGSKERRDDLRSRRPYSFSGLSNSKVGISGREEYWRRRRKRPGGFSAPASMRTSPTNSGLLLPTTNFGSSANESTMEELQSAIQAAIAHCKKSIVVNDDEEKFMC